MPDHSSRHPTDPQALADALNRGLGGCAAALGEAIALVSDGAFARMSWSARHGLLLPPAATTSHAAMRRESFLGRHAAAFAALGAALPPPGPRATLALEILVLPEHEAPAAAKLVATLDDRALAPAAHPGAVISTQALIAAITAEGVADAERLARAVTAARALPAAGGGAAWRIETNGYSPPVSLNAIARGRTVSHAAARVLEHHALIALAHGIDAPEITIERISLPSEAARTAIARALDLSPDIIGACRPTCR